MPHTNPPMSQCPNNTSTNPIQTITTCAQRSPPTISTKSATMSMKSISIVEVVEAHVLKLLGVFQFLFLLSLFVVPVLTLANAAPAPAIIRHPHASTNINEVVDHLARNDIAER